MRLLPQGWGFLHMPPPTLPLTAPNETQAHNANQCIGRQAGGLFSTTVTTKQLGKEKELQKMFRDILHPPPGLAPEAVVPESKIPQLPTLQEMVSQPDYLRQKNVILLIVGLALSSMLLTMIAL